MGEADGIGRVVTGERGKGEGGRGKGEGMRLGFEHNEADEGWTVGDGCSVK